MEQRQYGKDCQNVLKHCRCTNIVVGLFGSRKSPKTIRLYEHNFSYKKFCKEFISFFFQQKLYLGFSNVRVIAWE